jgi:hypothetical protein
MCSNNARQKFHVRYPVEDVELKKKPVDVCDTEAYLSFLFVDVSIRYCFTDYKVCVSKSANNVIMKNRIIFQWFSIHFSITD